MVNPYCAQRISTALKQTQADLVIGAGQKQALVTINERTSRYTLIVHVPFKTAQAVSDSMISLLIPFRPPFIH